MRKLKVIALVLGLLVPFASLAGAPPKPALLPQVVKRAVNAVVAGDPKPLKADLTPQMSAVLTRKVMQATKKQYVTPLGPLVSAKVVSTTKIQGMDVTIFQMHFQKGDMTGQLAQDAKGKVAGLFVRPGTK